MISHHHLPHMPAFWKALHHKQMALTLQIIENSKIKRLCNTWAGYANLCWSINLKKFGGSHKFIAGRRWETYYRIYVRYDDEEDMF